MQLMREQVLMDALVLKHSSYLTTENRVYKQFCSKSNVLTPKCNQPAVLSGTTHFCDHQFEQHVLASSTMVVILSLKML